MAIGMMMTKMMTMTIDLEPERIILSIMQELTFDPEQERIHFVSMGKAYAMIGR